MPNEQHFPAWPLITAVITHSPRAGAYTAKVEFPHAPVRILKRSELPPLRREVIAKVQQWTNDEWRKPVRLQVEDPDGRWVLGVPRDGPIVELDTIAPVEPPVLRTVSPASPPLPAAASSIRRPRRPSAPSAQRTARPRRSSRGALRPRVLAAGALTLVLAASAYALASTGSAPVHARAIARTTRPSKGVSGASAATATPAVTTAAGTRPAAARTAAHRSPHHAPARRRRARHQRRRATRRPAHRSHRQVVPNAPPATAPTTSAATASPTTTARARTPASAPPAAQPSHTRSARGCATTNCLPVPGNGPPPL